ncbi:MAG: hypothetical protein LBM87_09095 [Ruminococcus sp.]|jgi:hypothetical protein|nr:hypothetical protein [Ruminococcus sp.]
MDDNNQNNKPQGFIPPQPGAYTPPPKQGTSNTQPSQGSQGSQGYTPPGGNAQKSSAPASNTVADIAKAIDIKPIDVEDSKNFIIELIKSPATALGKRFFGTTESIIFFALQFIGVVILALELGNYDIMERAATLPQLLVMLLPGLAAKAWWLRIILAIVFVLAANIIFSGVVLLTGKIFKGEAELSAKGIFKIFNAVQTVLAPAAVTLIIFDVLNLFLSEVGVIILAAGVIFTLALMFKMLAPLFKLDENKAFFASAVILLIVFVIGNIFITLTGGETVESLFFFGGGLDDWSDVSDWAEDFLGW